MNYWIYIVAIVTSDERGVSGPGAIRFEHRVVAAPMEQEAYDEGYKVAKEAGIFPAKKGEVINDYVIKLLAD